MCGFGCEVDKRALGVGELPRGGLQELVKHGLIVTKRNFERLLQQRFRVTRDADVEAAERVPLFEIDNVDAADCPVEPYWDCLRLTRDFDLKLRLFASIEHVLIGDELELMIFAGLNFEVDTLL
jgi:hypothetical protein